MGGERERERESESLTLREKRNVTHVTGEKNLCDYNRV